MIERGVVHLDFLVLLYLFVPVLVLVLAVLDRGGVGRGDEFSILRRGGF